MNTVREIKAKLILLGVKQNDIAKNLGVPRQNVCDVIAGRKTSARIEQAIIEAGVPERLLKCRNRTAA